MRALLLDRCKWLCTIPNLTGITKFAQKWRVMRVLPIYPLSKIVRIDSVNNLKLRSHIYHHNIRNTTLHTIFHVLFLFICLNFSNKSKIKCATNAAAISGGMSHTMFPVIFVSILLYNLQKMFFSTFQQISMSNSHRTSCEFLKDIFLEKE